MARGDPADALLLRMSVDLARLEKQWGQSVRITERRLTEMERRAQQSDRRLSRIMGQAGQNMVGALRSNLAGLAPVLAGAFSVQQVLNYADSYTSLENRLRATGREGTALKATEDALYASANRNGVAVAATVELYQRASLARDRLGASEEQLQALVSGTTAALRVQGTSAGEASGPLLQLGQVLNGNKVQAEEYNSLIDGLPVLLQAVANGSDRFGGSIATLTEKVKNGEVTSREFFDAALKGLKATEQQAESMQLTVGGAFQVLDNQLGRYIGQSDSSLSASQRLAQGIQGLANNLDVIIPVVGAVATLMGGRLVLSMTAGTAAMIANGVAAVRLIGFQAAMTASMTGTTTAAVIATGAVNTFTAALAANPLGAALVAATLLAGGIYYLSQRYNDAAQATRYLDEVTAAADGAISEYAAAVLAAKNASEDERKALLDKAAALREVTNARIEDARVAAQKQIDEAVAARATADRSIQAVADRRSGQSNRSFSNASIAQDQAAGQRAQTDIDLAVRARQQADEALRALQRLEAARDAAENPTARAPARAAEEGKSRGRSGPTPEELARQRTLLELQAEVERLRAAGRDAAADAKQDEIDILNLSKTYAEAGIQDAEEKARLQVATLAVSREEARAREEAKRQAEGEARAIDMTRSFLLDMLDVQEQAALTDREALDVRRQILAVRQAERREALEAASIDADATDAEREAARNTLRSLPELERGEARNLEGNSTGAMEARHAVGDIKAQSPEEQLEVLAEFYAEIDRMRQEDRISEEEAVQAKAQAELRYRENRLANTRTMLDALATLQDSGNKKIAALGKAAAIAQATIDGVLAVQKALASAPPPINFVLAAVTGAIAAANVASIAGMADGGLVQGPGGPREDKVLRRLSAGEFVVNAKSTAQNRALLEQINNGGLPKMADGGLVGRAQAASTLANSGGGRSTSSYSYSPTVDARGADRGAVRDLERVMEQQRQSFADDVNGVRDRRARYQLGGRRRKK